MIDINIIKKQFVGFKGRINDNYSYFVTNIAIFLSPKIPLSGMRKEENSLVQHQKEVKEKYYMEKKVGFNFPE